MRELRLAEWRWLRDQSSTDRMPCWFLLPSTPLAPQRTSFSVRSPHQTRAIKVQESTENTILFVGRMSFRPNLEGILWFLKGVFPELSRQIPDLRLMIVGADPPRQLQKAADSHPGVFVAGRVDSVEEYYASARICIVPIRMSSGVQMKLIQGLAAGTPCIATTNVIEHAGLTAGVHLLEANSARDWVDACIALMNNPDLSARIASAGREWAKIEYSRNSILGELTKAYRGEFERGKQATQSDALREAAHQAADAKRWSRRTISVVDRTEATRRCNQFLVNKVAASRLVPNKIRLLLLRTAGVDVGDANIESHVEFTNFNVVIGRGARVKRGCRFTGTARISISQGALVRPPDLLDHLARIEKCNGLIDYPLHIPARDDEGYDKGYAKVESLRFDGDRQG